MAGKSPLRAIRKQAELVETTATGKPATATDANNNTTSFSYDCFVALLLATARRASHALHAAGFARSRQDSLGRTRYNASARNWRKR
jgi:hypothetical protein